MRITGAGYTPYMDKIHSDNKKPAEKAEERKSLLGKNAGDRLELSSESKNIKGYANQGINAGRIESLRQVIARGEYQVSSEELADAIMRRMTE